MAREGNPFQRQIEEILAAEEAQRSDELKEIAAAEKARRKQQENDLLGTNPAELFGEEGAKLCVDFLGYMARRGYPCSTRFGPPDPNHPNSLLANILFKKQPLAYKGYQIGRSQTKTDNLTRIAYPKQTIMLATDGKLRDESGGAINPEGLDVVTGKNYVEVATGETETGYTYTGPHTFFRTASLETLLAKYAMN